MSRALLTAVLLAGVLWPAAAQADFGPLPGSEGFAVEALAEGGAPAITAGSHPAELRTHINLRLAPPGQPGGPYSEGDARDIHIEEPSGLIENPAAVPKCSFAQFHTARTSPFEASRSGESCPDKSQIGVLSVRSSLGTRSFGLYDLEPPPGLPAEIGASPFGVPVTFSFHIRQAAGSYGVTLDLRNLTQSFDILGFTLTEWGTPWSVLHDTERGNCLNESNPADPWAKCSVGRPVLNSPSAYLTLPASCTGPLQTTLTIDSWQQPGSYLTDGEPNLAGGGWQQALATSSQSQIGCDRVPFNPETRARLSSDRAASPAGFDLEFNLNQAGLTEPSLLAPAQPRHAVVTLPEGVTVNPSVAAGLGVCTPAQYEAETAASPAGAGCPNASKIGTFTVQSPLFAEPLLGSLFLAAPFENPFGSLLGLYVVAKAPERGVLVKVGGELQADPGSGRLVATFDGLPQLPYSHFDVHFREGQRSPLVSPPSCGAYTAAVELTPWLEAATSLDETSTLQIAHGPEGSGCPAGTPPFHPGAAAGSLNSNAGSYSPFYLRLSRADTEGEFTSYSAQLPPGLLGRIAGIPFCPEAAIAAAAHESGFAEQQRPSCPAASEIGHTYTGYGAGSVLAYAPGGLYLAGPYHGAPLSVVAIDPATVGPFDLGTIVVRSAIEVDPSSARVSLDSSGSDPIPHILDGIPLHLRDIRVYIDWPGFTVNPTSCDPSQVVSSLTGSYAPFRDPRAEAASVAVAYQAANCSSLAFAPGFTLALRGGTHRGAFPSLRATYVPRAGDANVAAATVTLPRSAFLAQEHIRAVCPRPRLEAESCPPHSIYGSASATTPLLEAPMTGPVYLASGYGHQLPDLVAVLHGRGIRIVLDGRIDSVHQRLRGTFEGLPDAPVSRFSLRLFGGRRGILANEQPLCAAPQFASARFLAHDNDGVALQTRIATDCGRRHGQGHRHRRGHHHGKRGRQ